MQAVTPTLFPPVILVVDDEPKVRQLAVLTLRKEGYQVLEAPGGEAALTILAERSDVALVMTDCNMPGMRGPELAATIHVLWPEIKLVASSGQPRSPDVPAVASFLPKPYRPSTLRAHIAERLA